MLAESVRVSRFSAASGLTTSGVLISAWGTVTQIGSGYLYIDDGSEVRDGAYTDTEENVGVRVVCDPTGYLSGDYVQVTGISSCFETPSEEIARRILVRRAEDLGKLLP